MEQAHAGLGKLEKDSAYARALKGLDVDAVLEHDIEKITQAMSFSQMTGFMAIAAMLGSGQGNKAHLKERIKKISRQVVDRIDREHGGLKIPPGLRDMLFNL